MILGAVVVVVVLVVLVAVVVPLLLLDRTSRRRAMTPLLVSHRVPLPPCRKVRRKKSARGEGQLQQPPLPPNR